MGVGWDEVVQALGALVAAVIGMLLERLRQNRKVRRK